MSSSILHEKEVIGANYEGEIKLGAYHDGLYVYVNNADKIYAFNTINLSKITFDPPDRSINSSITAVALSPSHEYIVVGFIDGSIQSYEYPNPKPQKVISKARNTAILGLTFVRENTLLFMEASNYVYTYEFSKSLTALFNKEKVVCKLATQGLSMITPPIYRYSPPTQNQKQSSYSICSVWDNVFILAMQENLKLLQYVEEVSVVHSFPEFPSAYVDILVEDESTLKLAIFSNSKATLIKFTRGKDPEISKSIDIEISPLQVSFLTESVLSVIDADHKCKFVNFQDGSIQETEIPHGGFTISLEGTGGFVSFNGGKMYLYTLPSFVDKFDDIRNNDRFDEATVLCAAAIRGDSYACIGLPANAYQRELFVQTKFMEFFTNYMSIELFKSQNFDEIFDQCIKTATDMKSTEWITTKLLNIFKDEGKLPIYFKKIISLDPKASKFLYTREFFESLLENYDEPDIYDFISKLDISVSYSALVIKYAVKHNNIDFAFYIYVNYLKDIISGIQLYYNFEKYEEIVNKLKDIIPEDKGNFANSLISWLFSFDKSTNTFPRLSCLIKKLPKDISYIKIIYKYISEKEKPFSIDTFFNSLVAIVSTEKLGYKHDLYKYLADLLIHNEIRLSHLTIAFFLGGIFTKDFAKPDIREQLLLKLIERKLIDNIASPLMDLCDTFDFKQAKGLLMIKGKRYDTVIAEMLKDPKADVFEFMNKMIKEDPGAINSIRNAIESFTDHLLAISYEKLFNLVSTNFTDLIPRIPTLAHDKMLINSYLRLVMNDPKTEKLKIGEKYLKSYAEYLCDYYPDDVLHFVRNQKDSAYIEILNPIKANNINDASAFIQFNIGELEGFAKAITDFLGETAILSIKNVIPTERVVSSTEFISEMCKKLVSKNASSELTKNLLLNLIKTTVLAIFGTSKLPDEDRRVKAPPFRALLLSLSTLAPNSFSFEELIKFLMSELCELELSDARTTIISVFNDYQYDVDSDKNLGELFSNDSRKAYEDYITLNVKGNIYRSVTCCTCKKRLTSGGSSIRVFPCGHVFHGAPPCLMKEQCPICTRDNVYAQVAKTDSNDNSLMERIVKRKVMKFENDIHSLPNIGEVICDETTLAETPVLFPTVQFVPTI